MSCAYRPVKNTIKSCKHVSQQQDRCSTNQYQPGSLHEETKQPSLRLLKLISHTSLNTAVLRQDERNRVHTICMIRLKRSACLVYGVGRQSLLVAWPVAALLLTVFTDANTLGRVQAVLQQLSLAQHR